MIFNQFYKINFLEILIFYKFVASFISLQKHLYIQKN